MGSRHLIDSNIIIDMFNNRIPPKGVSFIRKILDSLPQVSIITEIEVLGFNMEAEIQTLLEAFFQDCRVYSLSRPIVEQTILLRKKHKIKTPDAIIAATALVHDLTIITRNSGDFEKIEGLKTVNPYLV
jgi:predicted nucleic acid-binding protein